MESKCKNIVPKKGNFNEAALVSLYGTQRQKESYVKFGRFVGNNKKNFLSTLSKYCEIQDLGNKKYKITKILENEVPPNFKKMNSSIYQFLIPLILEYLINKYPKEEHLKTFINKWAIDLGIINTNYLFTKLNISEVSHFISCDTELLFDFFLRSDRMIKYYFKKALEYLNESGYIISLEKEQIIKESDSHDVFGKAISNNDIFILSNQIESLTTKEDIELYLSLVEKADKAANIQLPYERYYSRLKAPIFSKVLKIELTKNKILRVYKYYEIYYTDKSKCTKLLKDFNGTDSAECSKLVSDIISRKILENANKRYIDSTKDHWGELSCIDNSTSKVTLYTDDYLPFYKKSCNMLINPSYPDISSKIKLE